MCKVIEEEVAKFKATEEGKGFWGLALIWTTLRSFETRRIVENMDHCITTKMEFPSSLQDTTSWGLKTSASH